MIGKGRRAQTAATFRGGRMRSKLFVPGSRPDLFAKALASEADGLSFDLEDAVPEAQKASARESVACLLASDAMRGSGKRIIVRCNALDSTHLVADIEALVATGAAFTLYLPKAESAADVLAVASVLDDAELRGGASAATPLLVNIESPRGLLQSAEIAEAHPRVQGLQLGLADLFEPFGIDRGVEANVHAAMFAVRTATAAAGIECFDAARSDTADESGFMAEARRARALGFSGKSCIHPRQVAWANAAFSTSAEELERAHRIVQAADAAAGLGRGAFLLDGKMVDAPFIARARALLAGAGRA